MSTIAASSSWAEARSKVRRARRVLLGFGVAAGLATLPFPALADLRLCNQTASKVGVTLGYRDAQGWVTEGWWELKPRNCETLLRGSLAAQFYYIYAVDYSRGGEWSGRAMMCTRDTAFTIRGVEDCLARGFDRNGFIEVDTGQQRNWTIQLSDPGQPLAGGP
ncbi:DUF1036 domain-containing protein [Methylorubrum rhodesianum]|uniref:DUF1036 domain-containing protein n=1 Tax=Methylorubrum rhodesianum TaxID=29427 RepID=A0ABU9ZDK6_9HYPH|nr:MULTISPECIES: DUF1036 domain-containing protein [Methylorubrum]MBI1687995.1 DUF1036 domain-containing protein [Methylorubrum sp. DB1722]MBK3404493.1 DUF1036 domain-containing protein [Methylorubrum rhodesianum]MBY0140467.1 DUF1036 domain-containing protein [Methylorubrum populi]